MALLVGRHLNKIDKKGRVSVPKPFRDPLRAQGFAGIYAYPLFKHQAIEACGEEFMARISDSLDDLDYLSDEQDDLASVIMGHSHTLAFDPEGRVVLPPELMEHAGISGEALFVGQGRRLQIWQPEAFAEHSRKAFERARHGKATLRMRTRAPTDPGAT